MVTFKLEFSEDALSVSNAAATWTDISDLLKAGSLRISGGIERLGDPPRAGEMSFTLLGTDFVPLNADSPYSPNVVRRRRFRYSILRGATYQPRFLGYARTFQPVWPGNVTHQEVEVVCGDGFDILSSARLPSMSPPSATSYEEVVMHDKPFAFYLMNEARSVTKAEPIVGPEGTYQTRAKFTLGEPGLLVGNDYKSVRFANSSVGTDGRLRIPMASTEYLSDGNELTVEVWVKLEDVSSLGAFVLGPDLNSAAEAIWKLLIDGFGALTFSVLIDAGTGNHTTMQAASSLLADTVYHIVATFNQGQGALYISGELDANTWSSHVSSIFAPTSGNPMYIGGDTGGEGMEGWTAAVAVYERALSAERVMAHYLAGTARGFAQQTAGERIAAAAASDLWSTAGITASTMEVVPTTKHGQSPLDVIVDAAKAEGLRTLFFFDGDGDPVYRGWEWQAEEVYSTVQETFGAPPEGSEIAFDEQALRFDDEVYSTTTKGRVGGEGHTLTDETVEALIGESAAEPITDLVLVSDADVERLCGEHLALYGEVSYAVDTLDLDGSDDDALEAILDLEIGDMIRFKRRSRHEDGSMADPIDVITWVIGFDEALEAGSNIVRTLKLARGMNGAAAVWRAGIVGFSEGGTTTVAA